MNTPAAIRFHLPTARRLALAVLLAGAAALPAARAADLVVQGANSPYSFSTGTAAYDNIYVGQTSSGTLNQSGGSLSVATTGQLFIGFNAGTTGTYNLSGGALTTTSTDVGDNGTAVFTLSGSATHNVTGTSASDNGSLDLAFGSGSRGTYNLNGGLLSAGYVQGGAGTSTFNFNGGTLAARQSRTDFLQGVTTANVRVGGAILDTAGFNVTVAQALVHDPTANAPATDGGLFKIGAGTLTLTGANTFTGGATFVAGVLQLGSAGALGNTGPLSFTGGTLRFSTANTTDYSARFSPADNQAFSIDTNTRSVTFAAGLSGGGSTLTKLGGGTLTLTGASTYTGDTAVNAGTLALTGSLTGAGNVAVSGAGSTLALSGSANVSLASNRRLTVDGTATVPARVTLATGASLSTGSAYVGEDGLGTFTQAGGTFTTNGNGLRLGDSEGSSGTYTLSGGSLSTGEARVGNSGNGTFNQSGGTFTTNNGGLYLGYLSGGNGTYTLSGGSLTTSSTIVSDDANTSVFTQSGGTHTTSTLALSGYETTSNGTYNLNGGTLTVGSIVNHDPDDATVGTSTFNFNGGTLRASASTTAFLAGLTTANVRNGGAILDTAGFNVTVAQNLTHSAIAGDNPTDGGLTKNGAGTLTLTGDNTYTGTTTLNAGTLVLSGGSTASRLLRANAGTEIDYDDGVTVGGNLSGPGAQRVLSHGATFSPTAGVLTIFNGVNLAIGGPTTFNQVNSSGALTVAAGQTLTWNEGLMLGSGRLSVSGRVDTANTELQGVTTINSGGRLANSGGNLYLTGGSRTTVNSGGTLSTASGTTIELNGSLLTNNGAQTGTVNVNFGGVAKGAGSFGTVNVTDGGRFSPGNSPGTAMLAAVSFGAGSRLDFELNSAAAADGTPGGNGHADLLSISGTLTLSAGTTTNSRFVIGLLSLDQSNNPAALADFDPAHAYTFTLATAAGGILGFDPAEVSIDTTGFANDLAGGSFAVLQDGNNLVLAFSPVPEPGTWALVAGGLGWLILLRRRRTMTGLPPRGKPSAVPVG